jgi:hypothetical protein
MTVLTYLTYFVLVTGAGVVTALLFGGLLDNVALLPLGT